MEVNLRLLVHGIQRSWSTDRPAVTGHQLETTGRKTGQPRHTAIGGRVIDNQSDGLQHGEHLDFVPNIKADPAVRVRIGGQWHSGTAHPLPEDDPGRRLRISSDQQRGRAPMGTDL